MQAVEDTTYQGWANYPTWCVNLWISNERILYEEAKAKAEYAKVYADDHPNVNAGIWTEEECVRYVLAEDLKSWVTDELAPDLGASFPADLLSYALGEVRSEE